jgi:hypothetical protein
MNSKPLKNFLLRLTPLCNQQPGLVDTVDEARRTWKLALAEFNFVGNDLIDFAIHNIKAAERRYMALINQARREGVTAWPAGICTSCLPGSGAGETVEPEAGEKLFILDAGNIKNVQKKIRQY